jgi:hypothetical protein
MIRAIISTTNNQLILPIPDSLVGKQLEVIAFAIDEPVATGKTTKASPTLSDRFAGKLSASATEDLNNQLEQARQEWNDRFPSK